jgi:hypothetical protein
MAFDLNSISNDAEDKPPRIVIYGVEGIGKTKFGVDSPSPIILQTEDGLGEFVVPHFPLAKSFDDVREALETLAAGGHGYETLVVDSIDWLQELIWKKVALENSVKSIEEIGYGKGYLFAVDHWIDYTNALNYLRDQGMTIIQIAHSEIKRFDDPNNDPYDRYQIKLHKSASAKIREHCDAVLFANYRISTTQSDSGFNKKSRAIGSGERLLFSEERPGYMAKNRFNMPHELPLDWQAVADSISYFNKDKK